MALLYARMSEWKTIRLRSKGKRWTLPLNHFEMTLKKELGSIHWGMITHWKRTIVKLSKNFLEATQISNL